MPDPEPKPPAPVDPEQLVAQAVVMAFDTIHRDEPLPTPVLKQLVENEAQRDRQQAEKDRRAQNNQLVLCLAGILAVLALCWLFLHYGKSDQIMTILTPLLTFLAGGGIGHEIGRRAERRAHPDQD